jgi:hypothetical protein
MGASKGAPRGHIDHQEHQGTAHGGRVLGAASSCALRGCWCTTWEGKGQALQPQDGCRNVHHRGLTVRVNIALSPNYSCTYYCTNLADTAGGYRPYPISFQTLPTRSHARSKGHSMPPLSWRYYWASTWPRDES